jgi:sugar (pentulose or hexulose) kinase
MFLGIDIGTTAVKTVLIDDRQAIAPSHREDRGGPMGDQRRSSIS